MERTTTGNHQRFGLAAVRKQMDRLYAEPSGLLLFCLLYTSREDLFYRLQVVPLAVPALRERRADISELCRHFIVKHGPRCNPSVTAIAEDALTLSLIHI